MLLHYSWYGDTCYYEYWWIIFVNDSSIIIWFNDLISKVFVIL